MTGHGRHRPADARLRSGRPGRRDHPGGARPRLRHLHKADRSPVTEADHAAEALIAAGLRAATPDVPVVAEEEIAAGAHAGAGGQLLVRRSARRHRAISPPGGTISRSISAWCATACRCSAWSARRPRRSCSAASSASAPGSAARPASSPIAARTPPADGLDRGRQPPPRRRPAAARSSWRAGRWPRCCNIGSALKFCLLAEGLADLYPRFGRTMEWDTGAAAGGAGSGRRRVRSAEDGAVLRYGKPGWVNPHFYATGRPPAA